MIPGKMLYIVFALMAAIAPVVGYLSWRSGLGQPYSTLSGLLILLIAIIIMLAWSRSGPEP